MAKSSLVQSTVKGGLVKRNARTGRFVAVQTRKGTDVARPKTSEVVKEASAKRSAALKRLADR